mgnify:CR=1 FL=1
MSTHNRKVRINPPVWTVIAAALLAPGLALADESQAKQNRQSEYTACLAAHLEAQRVNPQAVTLDPTQFIQPIYRLDEYDHLVVDYRPSESFQYVFSGLNAKSTLSAVKECRQYKEQPSSRYRGGGIKSPTYGQARNKKRSSEDSSGVE